MTEKKPYVGMTEKGRNDKRRRAIKKPMVRDMGFLLKRAIYLLSSSSPFGFECPDLYAIEAGKHLQATIPC